MNDEMIERLSEVLLSGLELEVIHQGRGGHGFNTASIKMRLERVLSALTPADLESLLPEGMVIVPVETDTVTLTDARMLSDVEWK